MPIAMINMGLRETSNYMNVMIVQNVLLRHQCMKYNSKRIKIMKNYNWEYLKPKLIKAFRTKIKPSTVKEN